MVFTNHTVRFKFKGLEGTVIIDLNTARNLELVVNLKDPRSNTTLFGILNATQTAMGGLLPCFVNAPFLPLISPLFSASPPHKHPSAAF